MTLPTKNPHDPRVRKISKARYDKIEATRSTVLKDIDVSALKAKHSELHRKTTAPMVFGDALHCNVFEPKRFLQDWITFEGTRKAGNEKWERFRRENPGRGVLTPAEMERVMGAGRAIHNDPVASYYVAARGRTEVSVVWTHLRTGRRLKVRIDKIIAKGKVLVELKSTRDVSPAAFAEQCGQLRYDMQLGMYMDGAIASKLCDLRSLTKIVAVESAEPFDVVVYPVPPEVIAEGALKYEAALDKLIACEKSGVWPGVANGEEIPLSMPMRYRLEDREANEAMEELGL